MWIRLIASCLVLGLAARAPPARAQHTAYGSHDTISKTPQSQYGETVTTRGLQNAARLFEIWRSSETGSWTMLVVLPSGTACVMASGTFWMEEEPVPPGTSS